ncbi:MAG TPA: IS630 family transposase, partial [Cyanobacteria bacterium UBA11148]|nr:IS630 family transposase [Cyanobacteria bacterium UBA11148]
QSLTLSISENIILLFQPAYSSEVNPIERLWEYLKEPLKWETFDNLQDLRNSVQKFLSQLSNQVI